MDINLAQPRQPGRRLYHTDHPAAQLRTAIPHGHHPITCGSTQIEISVTQKAPADGSDEGHYIYQDNSCSQIRWTKNGTQEFTYDANVHKQTYEYERLNQLQTIDPGLIFIYDSDMLRSLGLLGPTGNMLPVKVVTTLTNGEKVTGNLSYTYHSLDNWQRGEEIDGMEFTLRNNLVSEYRYVLTYLGI